MYDVRELLEIVLGDERSADIASRKIASLRSFPKEEDFEGLLTRKRAEKVVAAMKMSRCNFACDNKYIGSAEDLLPRLSFMKYMTQEVGVLVSLNSINEVINVTEITKGLVNATPMHPREFFRQALLDNAATVVIAHNHPSGGLEPSQDDFAITRVICVAGRIMQIPVLDHIIVTRNGLTSICRMMPEVFEKTFEKLTTKTM